MSYLRPIVGRAEVAFSCPGARVRPDSLDAGHLLSEYGPSLYYETQEYERQREVFERAIAPSRRARRGPGGASAGLLRHCRCFRGAHQWVFCDGYLHSSQIAYVYTATPMPPAEASAMTAKITSICLRLTRAVRSLPSWRLGRRCRRRLIVDSLSPVILTVAAIGTFIAAVLSFSVFPIVLVTSRGEQVYEGLPHCKIV